MVDKRKKILSKLAQTSNEGVNKQFVIFADDIFTEIKKSKNNDEIYEKIELLEQIANNVPGKVLKSLDFIIKSTKQYSPKIKTYQYFGKMKGKSQTDLKLKCIDILEKIRYQATIDVLKLLCLLANDQNEEINKKSLEALEKLGEYNLNVLNKIGYIPHMRLVVEIKKWSLAQLKKNSIGTLEVLRKFLQPEYHGGSMKDYKTYTYSYGPLTVSNELKIIRKESIKLLNKLYTESDSILQKQKIISTFEEGSKTPHSNKYGKDFEDMVSENTKQIIYYYKKIIPSANFEIIKKIEHQLHWFKRRHKKLTSNIQRIEVLAKKVPGYEIYSTLTGMTDTSDSKSSWELKDKQRNEKIEKLVSEISTQNIKEWNQRILVIIENNKKFGGINGMNYFNHFLILMGKNISKITLSLIKKDAAKYDFSLSYLLVGLLQSKYKEDTMQYISILASQKNRITQVLYALDSANIVNMRIIKKAFLTAKKSNNFEALNYLIMLIFNQFSKESKLIDIFVDAIKFLSKNSQTDWTKIGWYKIRPLILKLNSKGQDLVLENLIKAPDIDYEIEEILLPIAEKNPTKIIRFFKSRITVYLKISNKDLSARTRYDAIPFDFHKVNVSLSDNASKVILEILSWNKEKDSFYQWSAGELLDKIFPNFNKDLEDEIIKLIKKGTDKEACYVLSILRPTNGDPSTYKVIKEFIKKFPDNKDYENELYSIMISTGVVSGEDGFIRAYKSKKEEIKSWKKSKTKAVREFALRYDKYLDERILSEKRKSDEDVELRKREYGG